MIHTQQNQKIHILKMPTMHVGGGRGAAAAVDRSMLMVVVMVAVAAIGACIDSK